MHTNCDILIENEVRCLGRQGKTYMVGDTVPSVKGESTYFIFDYRKNCSKCIYYVNDNVLVGAYVIGAIDDLVDRDKKITVPVFDILGNQLKIIYADFFYAMRTQWYTYVDRYKGNVEKRKKDNKFFDTWYLQEEL